MESWTSYRLARRAAGNGPLAQWALWRLLRAGDRGETRPTDDLWDLWLQRPRGVLWSALSRWGRPKTTGGLSKVALGMPAPVEDVVEAARRNGHPIADIARARILAGEQELVDAVCEGAMSDYVLAAFCTAHQLAPSDPHRAAAYYLLTDQIEQYLLFDPDHSLLSLVYQGAGEDERGRIRVRSAGRPDLLRVLADAVRRGGMARLSFREAEHLATVFAERQDWPGLWELAKNLPVFDAVCAVRRCPDWRPDGPDAALFDAFVAADRSGIGESHEALSLPWTVSAPGTVTGGSITPDGDRVAVTTSSTVDVCRFRPGAEPVHESRLPTRHNSKTLLLDDEVLVVSDWGEAATGFSSFGYRKHGGDKPGIARFHQAVTFARTEDGFAALTYEGEQRRPALYLMSGSGKDFANYERRVLDVCAELGIPEKFTRRQWTMARDPASDLIAFAGHRVHLARLTADGLRPLASAPFDPGLTPYLGFTGSGRLVGLEDRKVLRVWQQDGGELRVVAERKISGSTVAAMPGAGVIATIEWPDNTRRRLRYLDPETLADLPLPPRFGQREDPTALFASQDGTLLGVGHYGHVELLDVGLTALLARPLSATTPADLHWLRDRGSLAWTRPAAKPLVELLHTCLAHRFGVDIAIGTAAPLPAHGDDIALGGSA